MKYLLTVTGKSAEVVGSNPLGGYQSLNDISKYILPADRVRIKELQPTQNTDVRYVPTTDTKPILATISCTSR